MRTNEKETALWIFGSIAIVLLGLLIWGVLAGIIYGFGIPDKVILAVILAVVAWGLLKEIESRRALNEKVHRNLAVEIQRLDETIKKMQAERLPRRVARLEVLTGHGGVWPPSEGFKEYMTEQFYREESEKRRAADRPQVQQDISTLMQQGLSHEEIVKKLSDKTWETAARRHEEIARLAEEKYRAWEREQLGYVGYEDNREDEA